MNRRDFLVGLTATAAAGQLTSQATAAEPRQSCDTFVYGSTPGGIAAAVEAARRGQKVILACPKHNPGGMSASGLCTTDAVRRHLFGGLLLEFVGKVRERYTQLLESNSPDWKFVQDGWFYEPSVAEHVFRGLIEAEPRIEWLKGHWLTAAKTAERHIVEVELEATDGAKKTLTAHTYIDATYEGDLAARAGVGYRVGREGREEHGESRAGIHYMNWRSGRQIDTPDTGEPSPAIQAFCMRSMVTDDPKHRIPIDKPATYDEHLQDYLPLLGDFASGRTKSIQQILPLRRMARGRWEVNGHIEAATSPNCPGVNWGYPEAGRHHRARLDQFHRDHVAGLFWFLQHDEHVPAAIAKEAQRFGLHDEEFVDNEHWPWQLYVRQGRRIQGRALLTQHSFTVDPKTGRTPPVEQPIALGEHSFDVHPCHDRRFAVDGFLEGVLWYPRKAEGPAQPGQIPYGAMLPKTLDNLLVPVALSTTHVAMSVVRMESVWMTTGQVAGLAAVVAREQKLDVAAIDPAPLPKTLKIKTDV